MSNLYTAKRGDDVDFASVTTSGNATVGGNATIAGTLAVTGALTNTAGTIQPVQTLEASGAITITSGVVVLTKTDGVIAATLAAPTAGALLLIYQSAGTQDHTVTLAAGTWDGTNDVATFGDAGDFLLVYGISATRYVILVNNGTVGFS